MPDKEGAQPSGAEAPTAVRSDPDSAPDKAPVRFTPGTMLDGRYRIVAILGRGGMGEVYRAEDTKLGQQVALKFLPRELASDSGKVRRLYDEVRVGRQVAHPNVCRMYDVSEWEGHHFISMEYIDGEDLASLLRRIGKLPEAKALDVARDLCAGLAATHALGIVHRDLKPANVMIDGRGDARITDFGVAALAEDLENRRELAGTPAYMAPEQLEGGALDHKTDLYALGLIFFEMFTGRRFFEGVTLGEIHSQHKSRSQSLSSDTREVDPAIQRVIARCLEEDPANRPASIHSVIASLPGGDPLQAAIEAGETPSPEMIAAAGSTGVLAPKFAWPLLILTVLVLAATAALSPRVRLYGRIDLPLQPDELRFKAREILNRVGQNRLPADVAYHLGVDPDYESWKRRRSSEDAKNLETADRTFSPLVFGYRESPRPMKVEGVGRVNALGSVPALDVSGMGQVVLEPDGRLRRFVVVPPRELPANDGRPDWSALFASAGLDASLAKETVPRWRPPAGSDARYAWLVPVGGRAEPVRVEAASLSGQRVWFETMTPWTRSDETQSRNGPFAQSPGLMALTVGIVAMVIGAVVAHRNLRRGRGDRQGAFRIAAAVFIPSLIGSMLTFDHYPGGAEGDVILEILVWTTFAGVLMWTWYLALEPYLRRRWPLTLIGWSRLVQGRWLDPLVGRSLLIGILAGGSAMLVQWLSLALPSWLGWQAPAAWEFPYRGLNAWHFSFGYLCRGLFLAVAASLFRMVILLIAHLAGRRRAIAIGAVFLFLMLVHASENAPSLRWSAAAIIAAIITWVMVRQGLLALAALTFTSETIIALPMTLDPSVWYFGYGLVGLAVLAGLAIFGFTAALGSHAAFAEPVLE